MFSCLESSAGQLFTHGTRDVQHDVTKGSSNASTYRHTQKRALMVVLHTQPGYKAPKHFLLGSCKEPGMPRTYVHMASTSAVAAAASHLHGIDDSPTKLLGSGQKPALARAGVLAEGLLRCGSAHSLCSPAWLSTLLGCCSATSAPRHSLSVPLSSPSLSYSLPPLVSLSFPMPRMSSRHVVARRRRRKLPLTQPEQQCRPLWLQACMGAPIHRRAMCALPEMLGVLRVGVLIDPQDGQ